MWLAFAAVLVTLGLLFAALDKQRGRSQWQRLAMYRERAVWVRYLPAFNSFFDRQTRMRLTPEYSSYFSAAIPDQYMPMQGALFASTYDGSGMETSRKAGTLEATFYFADGQIDPHSLEVVFQLDEALVGECRTQDNEFGRLVAESVEGGSLRTVWGPAAWSARARPGKGLEVVLRFSFPSPWFPTVVRVDRRLRDQFDFGTVHKLNRFLHREMLTSRFPRVYFAPPWPLTPGDGRYEGGMQMGHYVSQSGKLYRVWLGQANGELRIDIANAFKDGVLVDEFKPSFLSHVTKESKPFPESGVFVGPHHNSATTLSVTAPADFDLDAVRWAPPDKDR